MIFWNVILVNHLYFVWAETEINVTFHFCRLRQSTREKYCEYKWVIFRVDKCMDTFCIRIFYYSISQGFYSTIFYCRGSVSTWAWLSWYLSPSFFRNNSRWIISLRDIQRRLVIVGRVSANIGDIINPSHVIIISTGERFTTSTNCRPVVQPRLGGVQCVLKIKRIKHQ